MRMQIVQCFNDADKNAPVRDKKLKGLSVLPEKEKRVLIIDDDRGVLVALERLLRKENYSLILSDDPEKALEILSHERIDLIVADERMPKISGTELLKRAKNMSEDTRSIILTAYGDLDTIIVAYGECGVYKFLSKPWDNDEIKAVIRNALDTRTKGENEFKNNPRLIVH